MSDGTDAVTQAILEAYSRLTAAFWPALHAALSERARHRAGRGEAELRRELDGYVAELGPIGLFWKLDRVLDRGPRARPPSHLTYQGANSTFLAAAGVTRLGELVGRDDFDAAFPWGAQAARFIADDRRVMRNAETIGYIERRTAGGVVGWNRVAKAPILAGDGAVLGVLGMYESLEAELGRRLYWEQVTRDDAIAV